MNMFNTVFLKYLFLFACINLCLVCMCALFVCACDLQGPEEGVESFLGLLLRVTGVLGTEPRFSA